MRLRLLGLSLCITTRSFLNLLPAILFLGWTSLRSSSTMYFFSLLCLLALTTVTHCSHPPHVLTHLKSPKLDLRDLNSTANLTAINATTETHSVIDTKCGPWQSPKVLCINRYASVLPGHFFRQVVEVPGHEDTFPSTSVPADPNFQDVAEADFLVFDKARAKDILGDNPTLEVMFNTTPSNHDGPVYVPGLQRLYVAQVVPGFYQQAVVDLSVNPPKLEYLTADPPLYACTGASYRAGLIYLACAGGNTTATNEFRPGIYTLDPKTGKSKVLLNNYFGYCFNSADDLTIQSNGDIWFTDDCEYPPPSPEMMHTQAAKRSAAYSWLDHTDDTAPQLGISSYRFRPSTGEVQVVESSLVQPNGIGFSPDEKTLYITDTGSGTGPIAGAAADAKLTYNTTGPRLIYAFDVISGGTQINGRRPIYLSEELAPDGFKVARNGYLVTGTGFGVDILDPLGNLLVRIQTSFLATNIAWTGPDLRDLWIVGFGTFAKVTWALQGPALN